MQWVRDVAHLDQLCKTVAGTNIVRGGFQNNGFGLGERHIDVEKGWSFKPLENVLRFPVKQMLVLRPREQTHFNALGIVGFFLAQSRDRGGAIGPDVAAINLFEATVDGSNRERICVRKWRFGTQA